MRKPRGVIYSPTLTVGMASAVYIYQNMKLCTLNMCEPLQFAFAICHVGMVYFFDSENMLLIFTFACVPVQNTVVDRVLIDFHRCSCFPLACIIELAALPLKGMAE